MNPYLKFLAMIGVATIVMYPLMYLNNYAYDHIYWSETRAYMTLLMASSMALIMLFFMSDMLKNSGMNVAIIMASIVIFASSLFLVRSQSTVDDVAWMRGMIPHHSIAILTSERAQLHDPRVKALAANIIATQKREIAKMQGYIAELGRGATRESLTGAGVSVAH